MHTKVSQCRSEFHVAFVICALIGGLSAGCNGGGATGGTSGGGTGGTAGGGTGGTAGGGTGGTSGGGTGGTEGSGSDGGMQDVDAAMSTANAGLGNACAADTDCTSGTNPACLTETDFYMGGYCTSDCTHDSDCGAGGLCAPYLFTDDNGVPAGTCVLGCKSSAGCRAGYMCDTSHGAGYCMPSDCRVTPTVCTASETCNQSTGGCTATPLQTGYPAMFPTAPMVQNQGGGLIAAPIFVPIFFAGDSDASCSVDDMVGFYENVGATNFWKALSEYGVGVPTQVTPVMLTQTAPTSIDDSFQNSALSKLLTGLIKNGTDGTPAPDAAGNTIYILNFPSGTVITEGGGNSCKDFNGYHSETELDDGTPIAYAVLPRCVGTNDGYSSDIQDFTASASHELVEGVTDPFPFSNPGYAQIDAQHIYFDEANSGSELADMCENDDEADTYFPDFGFIVQRFWSNAAMAAGHDPCVPAFPGEVFFNGIPNITTSNRITYNGTPYSASSVKIAVGASATVPIDLYSDGPATTPWTAAVVDYNCWYNNDITTSLLTIKVTGGNGVVCTPVSDPNNPCVTQSCTGVNGGTLSADLTVKTEGNENTNMEVNATELFGVYTSQGTGMNITDHLWWGLVAN